MMCISVCVKLQTVSFLENNEAEAVMRTFSVIPENEGDDRDTYTVSGSFKAAGVKKFGVSKSEDEWQTVTFVEE